MTDMNKVLILTGGYVDIQWAKEWLADKKFDYCIAETEDLCMLTDWDWILTFY